MSNFFWGYSPRLTRTGAWRAPAYAHPSDAPVTALAKPMPTDLGQNFRSLGITMTLVVITNVFSHSLFNPHLLFTSASNVCTLFQSSSRQPLQGLFMKSEAGLFIQDMDAFEAKVEEIAEKLNVPSAWLMAVMYAESKFNPAAVNLKGSGATGLIQFMPSTALDLQTTTEQLRGMDAVRQLDFVYRYLDGVRRRYGSFHSLTQLYLAILFPRAIPEEMCFTLYASPSVSYRQNSGLDEDKDGRVTVYDIDRRMMRLYPVAYHTTNQES